ncbi:MAG: hypothetical protein Q4G26_10225 [Paracoccus sp. (in: a-proteobacteria)]|nr:hypothetical protein [Paracoccus sp. (in: a-proteobacteria)]
MKKTSVTLLSLAALLLPLSAGAEGWQNLYMADTGGSRMMQTDDPAQADEILAAVDSADGARLIVTCPAQDGQIWVQIGQLESTDGPDYLDGDSVVSFSVDGAAPVAAEPRGFMQSAYHATVPEALIASLKAGKLLVMRYGPGADAQKEFSLSGSARALDAAKCQ